MSTNSVHHSQPETYASPPITIILTVIILVFFFVGFFSIYFCRCFMDNVLSTWHLRHSPSGTPVGSAGSAVAHGLDPSIISSYPTFAYSNVKDIRKEKYGLECAICLSEFEDDNLIRLLTVCCHVFHQDCIDLWLKSHETCPVCRRNLDHAPEKSPVNYAMREINENETVENAFSINVDIKEDHEEDGRGGSGERAATDTAPGLIEGHNKVERFSRSHSTGHSIVRTREDQEDRYTLRLPEHIKVKIARGHNWTGSCTTFGDYSSNAATGNGGFGEVSGFSGRGDINKV